MSPVRESQLLIPSVLDRLLDSEPENQREAARSRAQVLRELKESVRQDLENLLSTRWRIRSWPRHLTELDRSLVAYGIPEFTGAPLEMDDDREQFRLDVERAIRTFEPRFQSVRVTLRNDAQQLDRVLRLHIDAQLIVDPVPEPVAFDSVLETLTGGCKVQSETQ